MQPKYTHNPSNIIKATEEAKRKSRHRLIGSIALLFVALIALLNVTAKVKPIAINPNVVEIKNSAASAPIAASAPVATIASAPVKAIESTTAANPAQILNQTTPVTNPVQVKRNTQPLQGTISQTPTQDQSVEVAPAKPKAKPKPQKINPADILNDTDNIDSTLSAAAPVTKAVTASTTSGKAYIQFAALSSEAKAQNLQQALVAHGVNATVTPIQTAKGTLYRLRAGPFSRSDAQTKLQTLNAAGYSGIVTGN